MLQRQLQSMNNCDEFPPIFFEKFSVEKFLAMLKEWETKNFRGLVNFTPSQTHHPPSSIGKDRW